MNDLIGKRFGRLTVLSFDHMKKVKNSHRTKSYWLCQCDCGNKKVVRSDCLTTGNTKSCGCLNKDRSNQITHGMSRTKLYHVYYGIIERCYNEKCDSYKHYGGRGIRVCEEWRNDFLMFNAWAKESGYEEGLTIEREDVNGNYEPSNCKWITQAEQANNTRCTVLLTHEGKTMNLNQWAKHLGINKNTFWRYIRVKHMTIAEIIVKCND